MPWLELLTRVIGSFLSKDKAKEWLETGIHLGIDKLKEPIKKIINKYLTQKMKQWNIDTFEVAKDYIKKANLHDFTELSIKSILDGLKDAGIRPGMINKAREALESNPKSSWYKREITKHPYAWRHLSAEHHSDDVIEKMRTSYIGKTRSTLQLQFIHEQKLWEAASPVTIVDGKAYAERWTVWDTRYVLSNIYTYRKVPNAVICVMNLIPLSYITKNNFFAGAYNFFWYAWWCLQVENELMYNKYIRDAKGDTSNEAIKKAQTKYLKQFRFHKMKTMKGTKNLTTIWKKNISIWKKGKK